MQVKHVSKLNSKFYNDAYHPLSSLLWFFYTKQGIKLSLKLKNRLMSAPLDSMEILVCKSGARTYWGNVVLRGRAYSLYQSFPSTKLVHIRIFTRIDNRFHLTMFCQLPPYQFSYLYLSLFKKHAFLLAGCKLKLCIPICISIISIYCQPKFEPVSSSIYLRQVLYFNYWDIRYHDFCLLPYPFLWHYLIYWW